MTGTGRVLLAILVAAALSACSGAGGGSPFTPGASDAAARRAAKSQLILRVRVPRISRVHRGAHFISAATKSMALSFTGPRTVADVVNLTPSDPRCSGAPLVCTIAIDIAAGSYTAAASMYDQAPVNGAIPAGAKTLSTASGIPVSVKAGVANSLALTLDGVPASIVIGGLAPVDFGSGFLSRAFPVTVYDAATEIIVGTYSTPIVITNSDTTGATAVTTSGSDNPPAHTLLGSSDTAALSYSGQAIVPANITAAAGSISTSFLFEVYLPTYVADYGNNAVKENPVGCGDPSCVITIGGGFLNPRGVATDANGNVYVADTGHATVKLIPPACYTSSCVETIGGGFSEPWGIAVDRSGNVYVADYTASEIKAIPKGCTSSMCVAVLGGGFDDPAGVALDQSGTVYVADTFGLAIKTMAPSCLSPSCVTTRVSGLTGLASSIAVDGTGNVYFTEPLDSVVQELPAGCNATSCLVTIGGGFSTPWGLAADWQSDVFVADSGDNDTKLIPPGCPSSAGVTTYNSGYNSPYAIGIY